ncbi:M48 family metalloprotease [Micromonospora sp. WMMD1082]|uniref:M48 family metalloprotease n=1 Tax=Micromonospora sp. WMMD1082 TaxID=3016104 RepID=UPI002417EB5B|nr:M48 family metalloprotease [Micromonospora sp. WMMD1082]MDG4795188.1 M48 family metalloprotease [Micromonospora sp. WMMD1082]
MASAVLVAPSPYAAAGYGLVVLVVAFAVGVATLTPRVGLPVSRQDRAAAVSLVDTWQGRTTALHQELRRCREWALLPVGVLVLLGLTPLGPALIRPLGDSPTAQLVSGFLVLNFILVIVGLPHEIAKQRLLVRYRFSGQGWPDWISTTARKCLFDVTGLGLVLGVWYAAVALTPDWWWLWAFVGTTIMSIAVRFFFSWRLPRLTKATPLAHGELRERLFRLAEQNGVNVTEVYVTRTYWPKGLQAEVIGYGPWRIVLADTLLRQAAATRSASTTVRGADDQIAAVVVHELAHARHQDASSHHVLMGLRVGIALCGIYLLSGWAWLLSLSGVESATDPDALGLLFLLFLAGAQGLNPVLAWVWRRREAYADWYALTVTDDPESLEQYWRETARVSQADPNPPRIERLFAHDPPVVDRIAAITAYVRSQSQASEAAGPRTPAPADVEREPA